MKLLLIDQSRISKKTPNCFLAENIAPGTIMFSNGVPYTYHNGLAVFSHDFPMQAQPQVSCSSRVTWLKTLLLYMPIDMSEVRHYTYLLLVAQIENLNSFLFMLLLL